MKLVIFLVFLMAMFAFSQCDAPGKIVIAGGLTTGDWLGPPPITPVEVIDVLSSTNTCDDLKAFPYGFKNGVGGLDSSGSPLICGGANDSSTTTANCWSYNSQTKTWIGGPAMETKRTNGAYATIYNYFGLLKPFHDMGMVVSGGDNEFLSTSMTPFSSASVLTKTSTSIQWSQMPSLPIPIAWHCMSQMDSLTLVVTGGITTSQNRIPNSYFYNLLTKIWTVGPPMILTRADHGCSFLTHQDGNPTAIVAGGYFNGELASVEIYNRALNKWESGPALPQSLNSFKLLPHPAGGVLAIGGYLSSGPSNKIFYLPKFDGSWVTLPQQLKTARYYHAAFWVPDSEINCSGYSVDLDKLLDEYNADCCQQKKEGQPKRCEELKELPCYQSYANSIVENECRSGQVWSKYHKSCVEGLYSAEISD